MLNNPGCVSIVIVSTEEGQRETNIGAFSYLVETMKVGTRWGAAIMRHVLPENKFNKYSQLYYVL